MTRRNIVATIINTPVGFQMFALYKEEPKYCYEKVRTGTIRFATGRQGDTLQLHKLWNRAGVGVGEIAGRFQESGI